MVPRMLLFGGAYLPEFDTLNEDSTPEKSELEAFYNRCVEHAKRLFIEDGWRGNIDDLFRTYGGDPEAERVAFYMLGATSMAESIKEGRFKL